MTNEEMERVKRMERDMEFIVAQQAQFATDIQQIKEVQAQAATQSAAQSAQFARDMQQVREVLHAHSDAIVTVVGMVGKIAEAHTTQATRMTELETKMAEMAQAQKELFEAQSGTERRLDAFIAFVQKYISGRDGGKN